MYYSYIIQSIINPKQFYIGYTADLKKRIKSHNQSKCKHTAKYKPWKLKVYIAFEEKEKAIQFEKYLKSGSGHAFSNKHF